MEYITGEQIILQYTDFETLLDYMHRGLTAKAECGLIVYDIDDPKSGPSLEERRKSRRSHTINEMRLQRGQPGTDDVSEFPPGYFGMSLSMPKSKALRDQLLSDIKLLRFDRDRFFRAYWHGYAESEDRANTIVERDGKAERAIWNAHIAPIVKKHNLKKMNGKLFEYRYFEKQLKYRDLDAMYHMTSSLCMPIKFPNAKFPAEKTNDPYGGAVNFSKEIVRHLRDCEDAPQTRDLKDGGSVDLRDTFRDFLDDVFENQNLPDFLAMLAADGLEPVEIIEEDLLVNNTGDIDCDAERGRNAEQATIQCPHGTRWEDIKITLTGEDSVRVETPDVNKRYTFHQLGMADGRNPEKATMLWALLKIFAKNYGEIRPTNENYNPKIPDTAKRLNAHMKKLFGIDDTIFRGHYKVEKGYRTKIFFSDETSVIK